MAFASGGDGGVAGDFARLHLMSAPFAIDPATGHVRFPDLPLELRPLMAEAEFIAATASINRDNLGFHAGGQRYSIRELITGEQKLGIFVIFRDDRLVKASFAYCPKDETWDNWSPETETARRKEYQQALEAQLGDKSVFPWGSISVIEDSKSGGTDIWVDYEKIE
jgi:hypothetical protein